MYSLQAALNAYTSCLQFDYKEYWQARYQTSPQVFEWYATYRALRPLLSSYLKKDDNIMHVGMGTSMLHEEMAADGYQHIVNTDYSPECVEVMQRRWQQRCASLREDCEQGSVYMSAQRRQHVQCLKRSGDVAHGIALHAPGNHCMHRADSTGAPQGMTNWVHAGSNQISQSKHT